MNTQLLEIFVLVARRLNFASVAEDLEVNASSISRSINQLEEHLGVRLFHRTTRSMTLTEAGAKYLLRVPDILEELESAGDELKALSKNPTGTLRLTSSVAFGEEKIMPLVPQFRDQYPEIKLQLVFTDENIDLIRERIDLAIRLGQQDINGLIATKLMDTSYKLCAAPDYIDASPSIEKPDDLKDHQFIHHGLPNLRTMFQFRNRNNGLVIDQQIIEGSKDIRIASPISLRTGVRQGMGLGLLATWMVEGDLISGQLVDVLPQYEVTATQFDSAVWLLYPSRNFLPQKARLMIDFLKASI